MCGGPVCPLNLATAPPSSHCAQTRTWNCPVPGPACSHRPQNGSATSGGPCRVPQPVAVTAAHGAAILSRSRSSPWQTAPGEGRREATVPPNTGPAAHREAAQHFAGLKTWSAPLLPPAAFSRNEVRGNSWGRFARRMREPCWGSQIRTGLPAQAARASLTETPRWAPRLGVYGHHLRSETKLTPVTHKPDRTDLRTLAGARSYFLAPASLSERRRGKPARDGRGSRRRRGRACSSNADCGFRCPASSPRTCLGKRTFP